MFHQECSLNATNRPVAVTSVPRLVRKHLGSTRGSSYIRVGSIISAIFTSELRSGLLTHLRHFLSFEVERTGRDRERQREREREGGEGGRENLINKTGSFYSTNNISLLSLAVITLDSMSDHPKYDNTHIVSRQSL